MIFLPLVLLLLGVDTVRERLFPAFTIGADGRVPASKLRWSVPKLPPDSIEHILARFALDVVVPEGAAFDYVGVSVHPRI